MSNRKTAVLFWTAAILTFLLVSVAASMRADATDKLPSRATRVAKWNASGTVRSVAIENVNGEVKVAAGPAVTATVEIIAHGRTEEQAKKALDRTKTTFENADGEVELSIEPPGTTVRRGRGRHGWSVHSDDDEEWSVEARWIVTVPANVSVDVSTVNGTVSAEGIGADLALSSVNGKVLFSGARGNVKVNTVNGAVDGTFSELRSGATVKAEAVNGNITLHLPKSASFRLSATSMSGEILSSFALPAAKDAAVDEVMSHEREKIRNEREKAREKAEMEREKQREKRHQDGDVETIEIDMKELDRTMAQLDREMADLSRNMTRNIVFNLNRSYEGTVGEGGPSVKVSNLNGKIVILAEGTKEADARPLVSSRHGRVITVPPVPPVPRVAGVPPVPPVAPAAPHVIVRVPRTPRVIVRTTPEPDEDEEEEPSVVQGDVQGDFFTTLPMGDVKVGKVSGKVRVSTHAGQINVQRAGNGAELKSLGGDVTIGAVTGDVKATTLGGNVEAGAVSGDARLETQGGDIVIRSCGGSVTAHTGGGDVHLEKVKGGVHASTSGGSIFCQIVSTEPREGCHLETSGGDVTLTLPSNVRASVEVTATGIEPGSRPIVSEFPELSIEQGRSRASASGKLNGGGAKVTIQSSSGTVTIKRGPAA